MIESKNFPQNKREALAYLYVQSRDLSELPPKAILDLYDFALEEISAADRANKEQRVQKNDNNF